MLDVHYELRYPSDKVSDSLKEAHNGLTQLARKLIEGYIRMSMPSIDWSRASMSDIYGMVSYVIKELNAAYTIFNTNVESTIVSGRCPKKEYTISSNNTWDRFNFLDDSSYNRLKFIIRPVIPTNIKDFFYNSKKFVFVKPEPLMAFPESEPSSLLDDNLELMECDEDITAGNLYPVFGPDTPPGFGVPESRRDGARLINRAHDIDYEFDAPLAPIN